MDDLARDAVDERMGAALARLGEYFMGNSPLQLAAEALAARLDALDAEYAVGGALAVNYHGVMRATEDVDVLIAADDLARFKECWLGPAAGVFSMDRSRWSLGAAKSDRLLGRGGGSVDIVFSATAD